MGADILAAIISQRVFRLMADVARNERSKINISLIVMRRAELSPGFGEAVILWAYTLQTAADSSICSLAEQFVDAQMLYLLEWWALTAPEDDERAFLSPSTLFFRFDFFSMQIYYRSRCLRLNVSED